MDPDHIWRDYVGPEYYRRMMKHQCSEAAAKAGYDCFLELFPLIKRALRDVKAVSYATIMRDLEKKIPPIFTTITCEDEAHNLTDVEEVPDVPGRNILCMTSYIPVSNQSLISSKFFMDSNKNKNYYISASSHSKPAPGEAHRPNKTIPPVMLQ